MLHKQRYQIHSNAKKYCSDLSKEIHSHNNSNNDNNHIKNITEQLNLLVERHDRLSMEAIKGNVNDVRFKADAAARRGTKYRVNLFIGLTS